MVVATASYEAREFGIHSGLPLRAAFRGCPDAVFLPSDPAAYEEASNQVMATLRGFPAVAEVYGWDEAFLGVRTEDPHMFAVAVRAAVLDETGLSSSVGIGDTKQRAKLATGFAKPAGIYRLTEDNWVTVMAERPTEALWGIGRRTAAKLSDAGIVTVAQLAAAGSADLAERFGPAMGPWDRQLALGGDDTAVVDVPWVPRSRSRETTFAQDLTDRSEIDAQVVMLAQELMDEVSTNGRRVARVAVKVRFSSFFTRTRIMTLPAPTPAAGDVERAALALLDRFEITRPVRLLGVRVEFEPVISHAG